MVDNFTEKQYQDTQAHAFYRLVTLYGDMAYGKMNQQAWYDVSKRFSKEYKVDTYNLKKAFNGSMTQFFVANGWIDKANHIVTMMIQEVARSKNK